MKKLQRLIEIKRQLGLLAIKMTRAAKKETALKEERAKLLKEFTKDEISLFKERIERACK